MKTLVQINAQYYENYGTDQNPDWRAKGGQIFHIRTELDNLMYDEETCVETIKMLLEEESNSMCRYEYISHEPIFSEPIELVSFDDKYDEIVKEKVKALRVRPEDMWILE